MKKLLVALAVLALVIVLLPMQKARADYHFGDQCPNCGEYELKVEYELEVPFADNEQHRVSCQACNYLTYEDHFGGTALCYDNAICEGCNNRYGEYAPHNWATTMSHDETYHYYACTNEGCTWRNEISLHDWGNWAKVDDQNHKRTCKHSGCGASESEPHTGGAATCTEKAVCTVCGQPYGEPLGHDWVLDTEYSNNGWDWSADCKAALGLVKCQRGCGATAWVSDASPVPGPKTYNAETGKVSCTYTATAVKDGKTFTGTRTLETDPIQVDCVYFAAGIYSLNTNVPQSWNCHYQMTYWEGPMEFNQVVQIDGEYYLAANVDTMGYEKAFYVSKQAGFPATCTEPGQEDYWKCPICKRMYSDKDAKNEIQEPVAIPAGHILEETKKLEPTCTEPGREAYWTCQRDGCGKMFSDKDGKNEITAPVTIKALGHDLVETKKVEPTCTEPGTEAYWTCQRDGCGKLFSDKDGEHEITEPVTIQALGHDLIHHDAQAPTCTAIGWDAYDTCSRCDYTTYAEKAALGHDLVHHAAQAPTCTAIGWEAYDTCSRCDYTTYEEKAALGHDYQITSRTITIITSTCRHCGDSAWTYNPSSRSLLDGLVRDVEGEPVDYSAGVSLVDGKRVLTVTPDPVDGEVGLYLTPEEAELWLKQGIDTVSFSTDFAALEIDLSEITAEWFPLEDGAEVDFFVFTLAPAENGAEVRLEALIGEEKTPAEAFTGIALRLEDQEINVTENGVYRKA